MASARRHGRDERSRRRTLQRARRGPGRLGARQDAHAHRAGVDARVRDRRGQGRARPPRNRRSERQQRSVGIRQARRGALEGRRDPGVPVAVGQVRGGGGQAPADDEAAGGG